MYCLQDCQDTFRRTSAISFMRAGSSPPPLDIQATSTIHPSTKDRQFVTTKRLGLSRMGNTSVASTHQSLNSKTGCCISNRGHDDLLSSRRQNLLKTLPTIPYPGTPLAYWIYPEPTSRLNILPVHAAVLAFPLLVKLRWTRESASGHGNLTFGRFILAGVDRPRVHGGKFDMSM